MNQEIVKPDPKTGLKKINVGGPKKPDKIEATVNVMLREKLYGDRMRPSFREILMHFPSFPAMMIAYGTMKEYADAGNSGD